MMKAQFMSMWDGKCVRAYLFYFCNYTPWILSGGILKLVGDI